MGKYAKAIVAVALALAVAVKVAVSGEPGEEVVTPQEWVEIITAGFTAAAVYLVPNSPPDKPWL